MVSNTHKKNIFIIFRLFSRESSCNSQKMDNFIELRSFQTYMVKSDKISAFREKGMTSSNLGHMTSWNTCFLNHLMLVYIRAKFGGHSICLWDFMEGGHFAPPSPLFPSNFKKPRKYRVKSSIVLSWEISLLWIILMIPISVNVFVKNYCIFLLKNGLILLSNRFTFLSLDNIPGAEPINQTLKEAQDTL